MPIVAMDFGTATCSVGVLRNDRVEIIANGYGNGETPSYVAFTDDGVLVGEAARDQAAGNPGNTIFDIDRLIGRKFSDLEHEINRWPFKVIEVNGEPRIKVTYPWKKNAEEHTPQTIAKMLLDKLKKQAEAHLGSNVKEAILTVPHDFSESQHGALTEAAKQAGLSLVSICSELEALKYLLGAQVQEREGVLVAHLGRHSLHVAVAREGGQEWEWSERSDSGDRRLFVDLVAEAKEQCPESAEDDRTAMQRLQNTELFKTIQRDLDSLLNENKQIRRVLLVGGVAREPEVKDTFRAYFTMQGAQGTQVYDWVDWRRMMGGELGGERCGGPVLYGTVLSGLDLAVTLPEDVKFVFLDIGPTKQPPKRIIQMAWTAENWIYNMYTDPDHPHSEQSRTFSYHRKKVQHSSLKRVLKSFYRSLRDLESKNIILVAHNAGVDIHPLIRHFVECDMFQKLIDVGVVGVTDSYYITKESLFDLENKYIPANLESGIRRLSLEKEAKQQRWRGAEEDCVVLEKVCDHCPELNRKNLFRMRRRLGTYFFFQNLETHMGTDVNRKILWKLADKDFGMDVLASKLEHQGKKSFSKDLKKNIGLHNQSVDAVVSNVEKYTTLKVYVVFLCIFMH